eukprot:749976-Hanusia_phi.AAC.2
MSLEECIAKQVGDSKPLDVERLCLDQAKCGDNLAALAPYKNLVSLSLQDCGITSLETLPEFSNLTTLKLGDNRIKGGLESITKSPEIEKLYLAGNMIPDIESLKPLSKLTKLEWLDLEGNPAKEEDGYSAKLFELIPSLVVLDGKDKGGEELDEADDDDDDDEEEEEEEEGGEEEGAEGEEEEEEEEDEENDNYRAILSGDQVYEEDEEDDDFQPPAEEPEDLEIEEEEDADLGEQTVLGKHEREGIDDDDEPNKK